MSVEIAPMARSLASNLLPLAMLPNKPSCEQPSKTTAARSSDLTLNHSQAGWHVEPITNAVHGVTDLNIMYGQIVSGSLLPLNHAVELPSVDEILNDVWQCNTRGNEYQPSRRKRLNTCGILRRLKNEQGLDVLLRRLKKGRWRVTHDMFRIYPHDDNPLVKG